MSLEISNQQNHAVADGKSQTASLVADTTDLTNSPQARRTPFRSESAIEEEMVALFRPPCVGGGSGVLSTQLNQIEERFLNAACVTQPGVDERALAARFDKTRVGDQPTDTMEYFESTVKSVVDDSVHCCAPSMIGHMTTSLPFYMRPLSKLVTTLHANNVKIETGKASTFLEKEAVAMMHRSIYGLPDTFYDEQSARPDVTLGVVCSGGTIANNTAMWIARNRTLPATSMSGDRVFTGCDKQGMVKGLLAHGYEGAAIIGSEVMHYSLKKAADVLGIGTEGLHTVPFNDNYQVDVTKMAETIEKCRANNIAVLALVGVAGGTETGSIDELDKIADLAEKYGIHFHVDAAWGGPVIFSQHHRDAMRGIERADTVTMDGHKQLYTPMGCGLCFLRDPTHIASVEKTANYIIRKDSYDLGKFSMEGSRPAVSMYLHANLEIMGTAGYGALIDRSIRLVRSMVEQLEATGQFETVLDPMTNILLYRFVPQSKSKDTSTSPPAGDGPTGDAAASSFSSGRKYVTAPKMGEDDNAQIDAANVALQNAQKAKGDTFVSRTTIFCPRQQRRCVALRVVIANPLTTEEDVAANLADQVALASTLKL